MNEVVKSGERECRGVLTKTSVRPSPIRAYMADHQHQSLAAGGSYKGLEKLTPSAQIKPSKSRSLVLRKEKVMDKFCFRISETTIPTLSEKSVKSLGKVFDCSLKKLSSAIIHKTCVDTKVWPMRVDKSGMRSRFKARVLGLLLLYDVPRKTMVALVK